MNETQQSPEETQLDYAGFWVRVWASIIDTVLFGLLLMPVFALTMGDAQWSSIERDGMHASTMSFQSMGMSGGVSVLLNYILPAIVVIIFWMYKSATPGKLLLKIRIVDAKTGGKPTTGQWLIRYIGYYVSAFVFMLGFIWVGFDRRKQGWHDKLASTVVISDKVKEPVQFQG
ncbi:putative RDD family membrane protein YckC [Zhongshania antarctica]|uniref:Putative RDD family membrane protein YckC n=1 Tax=Zhongshania antarctica TaxID=641702 RepID=A0A840R2M5_9GAMM|nr:RDD family protein [Zhongshania antarctica]MBB5186888.1 putative RDD family membrane protein YckC [Zhongshania antarctica]